MRPKQAAAAIVFFAALFIPFTSCLAVEHTFFSPEWKIDRIDKKIKNLQNEYGDCRQDAAREAGSNEGYRVLNYACLKEYSPKINELMAERDGLAIKLGYQSYDDWASAEFEKGYKASAKEQN